MSLFKASEGQRRLRWYLSVTGSIISYILSFSLWQENVRAEELLITFPIICTLALATIYLATTGLYWVLDGFSSTGAAKESTGLRTRNNTKELLSISQDFGLIFHKGILDVSGIAASTDAAFMRIHDQISQSWVKTAFMYAFGLTLLCLLYKEKDYFKSADAKEFLSKVANKYAELSIEENQKYFPDNCDPQLSREQAYKESAMICTIVNGIYVNFDEIQSLGDPLFSLNEYVAKATGLGDEVHLKRFGEIGRTILSMIEKTLA